jgi:adenylate kinase family enzyme
MWNSDNSAIGVQCRREFSAAPATLLRMRQPAPIATVETIPSMLAPPPTPFVPALAPPPAGLAPSAFQPASMNRVIVAGAAGSGKTTLARFLARQLNLPHIEYDGLFWNPGWVYPSDAVVQRRLKSAIAQKPGWVLDGNVLEHRELIWPLADTIIWLDYPMGQVLFRAIQRTFRRCWNRQLLWSKNIESFRHGFFSRDSFLLWAFSGWRLRRRDYARILAARESRHLNVLHFRNPRQAQDWALLVKQYMSRKNGNLDTASPESIPTNGKPHTPNFKRAV